MSIWLPHIFGRFQPLLLGSFWAFLIALLVKNPPAMQETQVQFLGQEDPLEKRQATHSSILGLPLWLSWQRICPQCERPGFNPWIGKIPWRREQLPTPVFWPGEFHGLYSGVTNSQDTTEPLSLSLSSGLLGSKQRKQRGGEPLKLTC